MQHGYGVYVHPNGGKYEGEYFNDKRHGKGKFTSATGEVEEGEWKEGEKIEEE